MNKFKNYVWTAAGFAVLAAVVSGISAGPAIASLVKAALVKNVDERGRIPYQVSVGCNGVGGACVATTPAAIGSNKRLVIEHISGRLAVTAGQPVIFAHLGTDTGSDFQHLPLHFMAVNGANDQYYINEQVLLYVEAGQSPRIITQTNNSSTIFLQDAAITGYLVDITP